MSKNIEATYKTQHHKGYGERAAAMDEFNESDHPRDESGKFGSGGGSKFDPIEHAKGVRAAAEIGGFNVVGAKNLKEADKVLSKASLRPTHSKVKSINIADLKSHYSKKKPVEGDTFEDSKGNKIEIGKLNTKNGINELDYHEFPVKGKGRTRSIFLDKVGE